MRPKPRRIRIANVARNLAGFGHTTFNSFHSDSTTCLTRVRYDRVIAMGTTIRMSPHAFCMLTGYH